MWLVVGLGNPGAKYTLTRHNVGFMAVDVFARSLGAPAFRDEQNSKFVKLKIDDQDLVLLLPQTFMNKSGIAVQQYMQFFKIPPEQVIVLHDEVDLPFGALKIVKNRGAGGHNGLKSINETIGTQEYTRMRIGVGRSANTNIDTSDHVLQNFTKEELEKLRPQLEDIGDAIETLIFDGYDKAASRFNRGPSSADV